MRMQRKKMLIRTEKGKYLFSDKFHELFIDKDYDGHSYVIMARWSGAMEEELNSLCSYMTQGEAEKALEYLVYALSEGNQKIYRMTEEYIPD